MCSRDSSSRRGVCEGHRTDRRNQRERDVALASAVQVVAALRKCGHDVAVVDTARGYIPEADEARELGGAVGVAPPSIEKLRSLERGLLRVRPWRPGRSSATPR